MNSVSSLQDKHVIVIGLGLHGGAIGTITWLATQGARISVSDTKTEEQLAQSVEKLKDIPDISFHFGIQEELDLAGVDMVIRNPGVPRTSPVLQRARELNIPVEMDSSLFFAHSPSTNIIGITGSKGKTTASSAIAHVLKTINPKTVAVGIDGVSPLGMLNTIQEDSPVVFELSSWRLEALQEKKISPHIAVVTSLYRDHLNTYASFEEYLNTKKQIIRDQTENDIAILNGDDERIRAWKNDVQGTIYWYALQPLEEHEEGIWIEVGVLPLANSQNEDTRSVLFAYDGNGLVGRGICSATSDLERPTLSLWFPQEGKQSICAKVAYTNDSVVAEGLLMLHVNFDRGVWEFAKIRYVFGIVTRHLSCAQDALGTVSSIIRIARYHPARSQHMGMYQRLLRQTLAHLRREGEFENLLQLAAKEDEIPACRKICSVLGLKYDECAIVEKQWKRAVTQGEVVRLPLVCACEFVATREPHELPRGWSQESFTKILPSRLGEVSKFREDLVCPISQALFQALIDQAVRDRQALNKNHGEWRRLAEETVLANLKFEMKWSE